MLLSRRLESKINQLYVCWVSAGCKSMDSVCQHHCISARHQTADVSRCSCAIGFTLNPADQRSCDTGQYNSALITCKCNKSRVEDHFAVIWLKSISKQFSYHHCLISSTSSQKLLFNVLRIARVALFQSVSYCCHFISILITIKICWQYSTA